MSNAYSEMPEATLIEHCRQGDEGAWEVLMCRYQGPLRRWIRWRLRKPRIDAEVEEIDELVWDSLWTHGSKRLRAYDPQYGFLRFLTLRAEDCISRLKQKGKRRREVPLPDGDAFGPVDGCGNDWLFDLYAEEIGAGLAPREEQLYRELLGTSRTGSERLSAVNRRQVNQKLKRKVDRYIRHD